jgi:hypothetical protein
MKTVFLVVSIVITLVSIVPYLRDILRHKTKPNIVSWITWTMLTGIATAAEINAGEYTTAFFTAAATLETGLVVVLGIRHGFVKYTRFDVVCQLSAVVGIVLWQLFDSPQIAIAATVVIDFIGALPTLRHSWQQPGEETWLTFMLGSVASIFAIAALTSYSLVALSFPLYLALVNAATATIILVRRRLIAAQTPAAI